MIISMFPKLFKFILFNLIFVLNLITLFAVFSKFLLLNNSFYIHSFEKEGVYKNLAKGVKYAAKEMFIDQLSGTENYDNLSLGERQSMEAQVNTYIYFISEENVGNFVGVNLKNITEYLNNGSDLFYFYLPIDRWNIPNDSLKQIPEYLKTTNISMIDILKQTNNYTSENIRLLEELKMFSKYNILLIAIGIILQSFLIFFYVLISKRGQKFKSIGKLFTSLGIAVLFISWILFTAQNIFSEGLAFKTGWAEILAGTLLPVFIKPLVITFSISGIFTLITGIILYNKNDNNQLVNKANFR